jgi:hypothetical protein
VRVKAEKPARPELEKVTIQNSLRERGSYIKIICMYDSKG